MPNDIVLSMRKRASRTPSVKRTSMNEDCSKFRKRDKLRDNLVARLTLVNTKAWLNEESNTGVLTKPLSKKSLRAANEPNIFS